MKTILLALAVWRLTSLFVEEDGPFDIFARLRSLIGVYYDEFSVKQSKNEIARGLTCVWCASIWFGFLASFFSEYSVNIHSFVIVWLGLSGAAIVIDSFVGRLK